jgi:hypothetical protein
MIIGKDIIELLSGAMYLEPLSLYREYIQNSIDAIEEAKCSSLLSCDQEANIQIDIDTERRRISICDNGIGVSNVSFEKKLLSFGASEKRGTELRGFRGIGRLSGLGYCQELIFRSRSDKNEKIKEIIWDARRLKKILQDNNEKRDLRFVIDEITTINEFKDDSYPERFFQVVLNKPLRIKHDALLNSDKVIEYLSQVAPVPFHPDFIFKDEILSEIRNVTSYSEVQIFVNQNEEPIFRPFRNEFKFKESEKVEITEIDYFLIEGNNSEVSALCWVAHHNYPGAFSQNNEVRGLRCRSGNMQLGGEKIFSDVFPEERFNSWTIGEVHVFDKKLVPNGRRDDFVHNSSYNNLITQLITVSQKITSRCRVSSLKRNKMKLLFSKDRLLNEKLDLLELHILTPVEEVQYEGEIRNLLIDIESLLKNSILAYDDNKEVIYKSQERVKQVLGEETPKSVFSELPRTEQDIYKKMFSLIMECSPNKLNAKILVDKILTKIKWT